MRCSVQVDSENHRSAAGAVGDPRNWVFEISNLLLSKRFCSAAGAVGDPRNGVFEICHAF